MNNEIALPSESQPPSLRQQVASMEHQFAMAAPRGVEARQIVRDVLTAISQNPKLSECDPRTVLGGAMTMAQLGLRIGVLGHGWLMPFRNRKTGGYEAQLVIGYQGLVELSHRSGQIASISARTVHENDHFAIEYGVDEKLIHRPSEGDRGPATGYYAVVRLKNGGYSFHYMTLAEAQQYRDRYAMAKDRSGNVVGPWKTEFDQMAKKSCLRQLSKLMPKNTDLATAIDVDDTVRIDLTPDSDPAHVSHHIEQPAAEQTASAIEDAEIDTTGGEQ